MLHRQIFEWCPACQEEACKQGIMPPIYKHEQYKRQSLWDNATDEFQIEEFVCPKGHITIGIHQNMQYEFLLDMGIDDLARNNYRGAFLNFVAAEERFFEFFIETICAKRQVPYATFNDTWKQLKNLSERQYGAFCFLYLLEFNAAPYDTEKEKVENEITHKKHTLKQLRNKVVHQGYKPTENETKFYGDFIIHRISDMVEHLKKSPEAINFVVTARLNQKINEVQERYKDKTINISTCCGGSICSALFRKEPGYKPIDILLKAAKKHSNDYKRHYGIS